jgi:hypothetical protein
MDALDLPRPRWIDRGLRAARGAGAALHRPSVGAAADAALRGIEGRDTGIERRHHIGEPLPARIVQMRAAALGPDRLAQAGARARNSNLFDRFA